ncbi:hypothetical protein YC2023_056833 [Brassica napus]
MVNLKASPPSEINISHLSFFRLIGNGSNQTASSSKLLYAHKIEPLTITEFFCTTKVTGIKTSKRWCYIGCSKCTKRFQREISSFTCVLCDMWVS